MKSTHFVVTSRALLGSGLLLFGCAHTDDREMSAEEQRQQSALARQQAERERARFDNRPNSMDPSAPSTTTTDDSGEWSYSYNPSAQHLAEADEQMRLAAQHLRIAKDLETFEDKACKDVSVEQRVNPPLLASSVETVQETKDGIILYLKPSVSAEDTAKVLNCHLAYSYTRGVDRPSVPLFVKGVKIREAGGNKIEIKGENRDAVNSIHQQARRLFQPTTLPAASR